MLNDLFCGFEGIDGATPSIGDVNNDGLPDILLGGHGATHEITTWIYVNNGDFSFSPVGAWYDEDAAWTFDRISHGNNHLVDYNNDGYLDAWNMGWAQSDVCQLACATQLWKNESASAGIPVNNPPTAPTNLRSSYDAATGMMTFSWDAATDDHTPQEALQYNIYVKFAGSDDYFMAVPADLKTGKLKVGEISGQIMGTSYSMYVESEDAVAEWDVQAIDNGKRGSNFSKYPASSVDKNALADLQVYAADGNVHYNTPGETRLDLFNSLGVPVQTLKVMGAGMFPGPGKGLYLLKATLDGLSEVFKLLF